MEDEAATEELNYMIDHFEDTFHVELPSGYNEDVIAYRINLDPVHAHHRPLAFYVMIMCFTHMFNFCCQFVWGMTKYGPENHSNVWNLITEPQQEDVTVDKVSYWFREGNREKKPVVFIHGIGAGLVCYITFLANLLAHIDAPIFFVELPHVSMHCIETVPTMAETVRDLKHMLHRHQFEDAVFVAHSLGTAVASWVVKYMQKQVAGIVLLDPVCFMLHYKDV